jgi:hypothetical protein
MRPVNGSTCMSMIHQMIALDKEKLDFVLEHPEEIDTFLDQQLNEGADEFSLYKSWHLMHFLINNDPWEGEIPYGWAVCGGTQIGEDFTGYGPARILLPEQVNEVAQALRALSADELFEDYDPAAMRDAKLYSAPDPSEDAAEEKRLRDYYEEMVDYYTWADQQGYGIITCLF